MPSAPGPHVHLDNRSLFLSDGARTVMFSLSQTRWLAETLEIIAADGRASRDQQHHVFGGFRADSGAVVLYAGAQEDARRAARHRRGVRAAALDALSSPALTCR